MGFKKIGLILGFLVMLILPSKLYSSASAATAVSLSSGSSVTKTIKLNESHDYTFTTNKDGEIYLTLDKNVGGMYVELEDVHGENKATEYIYSGGSATNININVLKGTYRVYVKPYRWDGMSSSNYTLKVTYPGTIKRNEISFEPNDTFETAYPLTNGKSNVSTLGSKLDVDKYKFTTNKDGEIYLTLDESVATNQISLYDESGNHIGSDYNYHGFDAAFIKQNVSKGTYYVEVRSYDWRAVSSAEYRLKASFSAPFKRDTKLEPNDTMETAYPITSNKSYTSTSFSKLDIDTFKISTSKKSKVRIKLDKSKERYLLELYDLYQNRKDYEYMHMHGSSTRLDLTLDKGVYFIRVTPYEWDGVTSSNYRIQASFQDKIPAVDSVSNLATVIKGKTETGSKVYAYAGSTLLGSTTALDGKYTIKIAKQKVKTVISVYMIDKAGVQSRNKNVTVIDKTPKVNSISNLATVIKGTAETGAKVNAYVDEELIGSAIASAGKYTIKIAKQNVNATVEVQIVDKSGVKSATRSVNVVNKTPKVNAVSNASTTIKGTAETGAKVYAYVGEKLIGSTKAVSGKYTIKIAKQKAKVTITVHIVDQSGVKSATRSVKVADKIAPTKPTVAKVTTKSTYVSGKTEAFATVYIYNDKKYVATGAANREGKYKIKIAKQKKGSTINVYALDAAENKSKIASKKVFL